MTQQIAIGALSLGPTACCTAEFPKGALHGSLQIGTQMFHAEAYQVKDIGNGVVGPVLPAYTDEVEAVYTLSNSSLSTQKIDGNDYVIVVFPFAR